ncbi:MAG: MFS transporter [Gammaproteobacteria bacterium]|nr:MFS transporter [Gammaproteobacteria bacterium]
MNAPATKDLPQPPVGRGAFYGWWIVAATFVVGFLVAGGTVNALGVLVKPIAESLNVGRAELGAVITVKLIVNALLSPWVGSMLATRSIRGIMLVGAAAMGLGLAMAAFAQSLWPIYLGLGVLAGVASTAALFLPCIALVSNWFDRLRGRALGLVTLGPTLSGAVVPVLLSLLVDEVGWRTSLLLAAAVATVILLPVIWFFVLDRPEDCGQFPDGDPDGPRTPEAEADDTWTIRRAVRSRDVWLVVGTIGTANFAVVAMLVHLIPYATDTGLSGERAALVFSVMTLLGALGGPLFGTLADYLSIKRLLIASMLCQFAAVLLFAELEGQFGLSLAAGTLGLGFGGLMPLVTLAVGRMFGVASLTRIMGLATPLSLLFYAPAAPLTGYLYDTRGDYELALQVLLVAPLLAIAFLCFLKVPRARD